MALDHLKRPKPAPRPTADSVFASPTPRPTAPAPTKANVPAAVESTPSVVHHRCGHMEPLSHLASIECPQCLAAKRKRRAAKRQQQLVAMAGKSAWPNRLPAGSVKVIRWTGEYWTGTLTVPGTPDPSVPSLEVTYEAATEREVCHGLHKLFVDWLNKATPPA